MNIMFILFPGFSNSANQWDFNYKNGKYTQDGDFLQRLKKLGKVYTFTPPFYNFNYYKKWEYNKLFDKNITEKVENVDIITCVKNVYDQVKNFDGLFVPIGHSFGAYFVYYFCNLYSNKCLFSVMIDGEIWHPYLFTSETKKDVADWKMRIKKATKMTNKQLSKIIIGVYENNEKKIYEYADFVYNKIHSQAPTTNNLKVKTIQFRNIFSSNELRLFSTVNFDTFMQKSEKYLTICFNDKDHYLHLEPECRDVMLILIESELKNLKK